MGHKQHRWVSMRELRDGDDLQKCADCRARRVVKGGLATPADEKADSLARARKVREIGRGGR